MNHQTRRLAAQCGLPYEVVGTYGKELEAFERAIRAQTSTELMMPTNADLLLMAGEMTAQEMRTVRAVLMGLACKIAKSA